MTRIKICGLTRLADIDMVNSTLPDYVGFVFAESRRQISEDTARELKSKLNSKIQAVGVFVNEDQDNIIRLCETGVIDRIQLHGDEDRDYIKKLKNNVNIPLIKAIRVRGREDIKKAEDLPVDFLLLDSFRKDQYGGSGEAFDWTLIREIRKPFFLAGGIQSENVLKAIEHTKPYCVDVSSGVETDGFKDCKKVTEIITKVRGV